MCGRFALYADKTLIKETFKLASIPDVMANYNVCPSSIILAITLENERRVAKFFKWQFAPTWLKDPSKGQINARCETVNEKPFFRQSYHKRRCLIIMNGWYEWKKEGAIKQPYYFSLPDDQLMAVAGIWTVNKAHDFASCAMLTKDAVLSLISIHQRMPVLVDDAQIDDWLTLGHQLENRNFESDVAKCVQLKQVGLAVNNPTNNYPDLIN